MADPHKRDTTWHTDLLWHYFHEDKSTATKWAHWYRDMDPLGELKNRHRVYEILVDEPAQTNPNANTVGASKIPWNQNNTGFLKTVGGGLWCGSLVKIVFTRYMGWNGVEPKSESIKRRGFNAALFTINNLRRKVPVRANLGGHHYVGIVGHRCIRRPLPPKEFGPEACSEDNEFLCIDPWAGGIQGTQTIIYAGTETAFLGVIVQTGSTWKYTSELIVAVEAPKNP
jgi:hypothetical protein